MRVVVGSIVGLIALWLAVRGESPGALYAAVRQADPWWTVAALVSIACSLALVTERWRILFGRAPVTPPKWGVLFRALVLGQAVNIVLPIRIGELIRVLIATRSGGQTIERSFVTVVAERLMDAGMVALAASWLVLQVSFPPWLVGPVRVMTLVGLIAAGLGVALMVAGRRVSAYLARRVNTAASQGLARLARRGAAVVEEVAQLRDPWVLGWGLGISVALVFVAALTNYLLFMAFHLNLPPTAAVLVLLVLQVGSAPVSTPGNLGVFQYLTVLALGVYSVDRTVAVAYSMVLYLIAYGPKLIMGSWLMARMSRDAALGIELRALMRGQR